MRYLAVRVGRADFISEALNTESGRFRHIHLSKSLA